MRKIIAAEREARFKLQPLNPDHIKDSLLCENKKDVTNEIPHILPFEERINVEQSSKNISQVGIYFLYGQF